MPRLLVLLCVLCASAVNASPAAAQSSAIGFQAKLTGVADGPHTMTFSLYDVETGGTPLQTVGPQSVMVQDAVVSTSIAFDAGHWTGPARWIGFAVDGGAEASSRMPAHSVPFATRATYLDSPDYAIAGSSVPSLPAYSVRTYDDPSLHPEFVPNFAGTGRSANLYRAIGSAWERSVGLGFYVGEEIASTSVWISNAPGNRFEVNIVNPGSAVYDGNSALVVSPDGTTHAQGLTARTLTLGAGGSGAPVESLLVDAHFDGVSEDQAANFRVFDGGIPGNMGLLINYKSSGGYYDILRAYNDDPHSTAVFRVHSNGTTVTKVLTITGGSDLAEPFNASPAELDNQSIAPAPGMVMSIDRASDGRIIPATQPYDTAVAGVISGANGLQPGMLMGKEGDPLTSGQHPLAMTGRVWVLADASFGPIRRGDRLTTSATPGHAMRVSDGVRASGAVIGKAMTELEEGRGHVLVLVNLQ